MMWSAWPLSTRKVGHVLEHQRLGVARRRDAHDVVEEGLPRASASPPCARRPAEALAREAARRGDERRRLARDLGDVAGRRLAKIALVRGARVRIDLGAKTQLPPTRTLEAEAEAADAGEDYGKGEGGSGGRLRRQRAAGATRPGSRRACPGPPHLAVVEQPRDLLGRCPCAQCATAARPWRTVEDGRSSCGWTFVRFLRHCRSSSAASRSPVTASCRWGGRFGCQGPPLRHAASACEPALSGEASKSPPKQVASRRRWRPIGRIEGGCRIAQHLGRRVRAWRNRGEQDRTQELCRDQVGVRPQREGNAGANEKDGRTGRRAQPSVAVSQ